MITDAGSIWKFFTNLFSRHPNETRQCHYEETVRELPIEVRQLVGSFLSAKDLRSFIMTSKSVASDLDLEVASSALTDSVSQTKKYQPGYSPECLAVVIPTQEARCHSMSFCCEIPPNQLNFGDVWITEQDLPEIQIPDNLKSFPFRDGKVLAAGSTKNTRYLALDFDIQPKKMYQIWINGHGSYYTICLANMKLIRVGFGAGSTDYKAYQFDVFSWTIQSFIEESIR